MDMNKLQEIAEFEINGAREDYEYLSLVEVYGDELDERELNKLHHLITGAKITVTFPDKEK